MIVWDLDGTLANCDHRRHFVDPRKRECCGSNMKQFCYKCKHWQPDWPAFYEACDQDEPIYNTISVLNSLRNSGFEIQIWSGRCESVRKITKSWLNLNCECFALGKISLKMRPIGDSTPDEVLFEKWLNERCADMIQHIFEGKPYACKHDIDFVFSANPDVISMFKRRGIFVFDCNQDKK